MNTNCWHSVRALKTILIVGLLAACGAAWAGSTQHLQPRGEDLDDTENITTALAGVGSGDTVVLDAGVYNVTNAIVVPRGVSLLGAGRDTTTVRYVGGVLKNRIFNVKAGAVFGNLAVRNVDPTLSTRDCYGVVLINDSTSPAAACTVTNVWISDFYHRYGANGEGLSGSMIKINSGVAHIVDCVLSNNTAIVSGGSACVFPGIYNYSTSAETVIERCRVVKNTRNWGNRKDYSAPVYSAGGVVRNCLVADNTPLERITGLYGTGTARFVNCTVAYNRNTGNSGTTDYGACYGSAATVEFVNCLIVGNTDKSGRIQPFDPSSLATVHHCSTNAPTFRDSAHGDYYVTFGEGINAGTNEDWMATAADIAGAKRILEGQADVGCFEYVPGALWCKAWATTATRGGAPLAVSFAADAKGADLEGLVYHWAFEKTEGYDLEGTDCSAPTWTYATNGSYSVRLRVTNTAGEIADAEETVPVTVSLGTVYVATNSVPEYPYDTPAKAAADFATLMATGYVGEGTEIRVCPGVHSLPSTLAPDGVVRIVSTDGPEVTTLKGATTGFQLITLSKAGSVLSGFTLTGTRKRAAQVTGGTVSNCVFRNMTSSATENGTGGVALYLGSNATAVDCRFANNCFSYAGGSSRHGGTVYASGSNITIDRCTFTDNAMGTESATQTQDRYGIALYLTGSGTIRNSLFTRQTTYAASRRTGADTRTSGTVALFGAGPIRVENCTVVSNLAEGASTCGGIYCADATAATVENTILFGGRNSDGTATDLRASASSPSKTTLVTNLVNVDPRFRLRAKDDWRLRSSSPAWESGTNESWMSNATDLYGARRLQGHNVDIGCAERPVSGFAVFLR